MNLGIAEVKVSESFPIKNGDVLRVRLQDKTMMEYRIISNPVRSGTGDVMCRAAVTLRGKEV